MDGESAIMGGESAIMDGESANTGKQWKRRKLIQLHQKILTCEMLASNRSYNGTFTKRAKRLKALIGK